MTSSAALSTQEIAAKRGWQTFADGVIVVAMIAGLTPLIGAVQGAESWQAWLVDWHAWSWSMFQGAMIAAGTALVAWLRRRFLDRRGTDPDPPAGDEH